MVLGGTRALSSVCCSSFLSACEGERRRERERERERESDRKTETDAEA
eukprot:COSAG03_NODE_29749_length_177_cov_674.115385_1_plen_47_part_10